jgi:hypothetical protein
MFLDMPNYIVWTDARTNKVKGQLFRAVTTVSYLYVEVILADTCTGKRIRRY